MPRKKYSSISEFLCGNDIDEKIIPLSMPLTKQVEAEKKLHDYLNREIRPIMSATDHNDNKRIWEPVQKFLSELGRPSVEAKRAHIEELKDLIPTKADFPRYTLGNILQDTKAWLLSDDTFTKGITPKSSIEALKDIVDEETPVDIRQYPQIGMGFESIVFDIGPYLCKIRRRDAPATPTPYQHFQIRPYEMARTAEVSVVKGDGRFRYEFQEKLSDTAGVDYLDSLCRSIDPFNFIAGCPWECGVNRNNLLKVMDYS